MPYSVHLLPAAHRDFQRLPKPVRARIAQRLMSLADEPRPASVVKLAGVENLWRIRIGAYRIIYEIHDDRLTVLVLRVMHRKDVYRGL